MQKVRLILLALVIGLLLGGCASAPAGPATDLHVEMSEFSFSPNSFSVPAGKKITLELRNSGSVAHNFILLKKEVVLNGVFDPDKQAGDILFQAGLDAGKTGSFSFVAPSEPGDYQVVCDIPGHYQSGMIAVMTVTTP